MDGPQDSQGHRAKFLGRTCQKWRTQRDRQDWQSLLVQPGERVFFVYILCTFEISHVHLFLSFFVLNQEPEVHRRFCVLQNQFRTKGLDLIKLTKKVEEQNETLAKLKEEHGALAKEMRNLEAKPTDDDLPGTVQELVDR